MKLLTDRLALTPLFYVTRDIERALGLHLPGYFIISNSTVAGKQIAAGRTDILLIENASLLDTHELLNHSLTQEFITQHTQAVPQIIVFKNTTIIEKICAEKNWHLLNPSAVLSQKVEEKISQVNWLGDLAQFLPPHKIQIAKEVSFEGRPFILQFNRAHTGMGTHLIGSQKELTEIQQKFPDRPVRITKFIQGPMFTNNNVVTPDKILLGNINYQITGLSPFTDQPFSTIGNDWGLPHVLLNDDLKEQYITIAEAVGEKLRESGWKGLFGIDVILDDTEQKLSLIEINARQPASTTYESQLQKNSLTTFEAHLLALLDESIQEGLTPISEGAQIILRNGKTPRTPEKQTQTLQKLEKLHLDLTLIPYNNTEPGSDWIRIQTSKSFMQNHNQLNELGEKIKNAIV